MDTGRGVVTLEDGNGAVLAKAFIAPLAAPRDLLPHTIEVVLRPKGVLPEDAWVHVRLDNDQAEVTQLNNVVPLTR